MGPSDCRLTTRYDETDFTSSLYGVMHEAGHGLYDQGLLKEYYGTPMGDAVSLGIHESQSRLWENKVGRSRSFWEFWYPRAMKHFPGLEKISLEDLLRAVNRVERSFIRVEADEVSYDLHIMLRFQIEVLLMEGNLEVKDVPEVWNTLFQQLFGLAVPDDARGCLQDIHWSMGGLGYFATYTLGNLNSAQLFRKATLDLPGLQKDLASGNYASLLKWLREKVHRHGQRYDSPQLMIEATGESTQAKYHLEYLRDKFL
jgi:carboxypeptidase Taq